MRLSQKMQRLEAILWRLYDSHVLFCDRLVRDSDNAWDTFCVHWIVESRDGGMDTCCIMLVEESLLGCFNVV